MALGKELGEDFYSPSDLRSELEVELKNGTTVRNLFGILADRYSTIREKIFDPHNAELHSRVLLTFNDKVVNQKELLDRILRDGDTIRVLQVHTGG